MEKISIIIPVYNCEKLIAKCLESIISQTYTNLEIICINDGSTDNTIEILNKYKEKDNRIIVINQENKKQGAARNKGLEIAKGKFITFVDSDDWIDNNYIFELYQAIKKDNFDVAISEVKRDRENKSSRYMLKHKKEKRIYNIKNAINELIVPKDWYVIWAKLYKKEVIGNIRFEEGVFYEDPEFLIRVSKNIKNIIKVKGTSYHYLKNPNSTIHTNFDDEKRMQRYNSVIKVYNFAKENNIKIKEYCMKKENFSIFKFKKYVDKDKIYILNLNILNIKKENKNIQKNTRSIGFKLNKDNLKNIIQTIDTISKNNKETHIHFYFLTNHCLSLISKLKLKTLVEKYNNTLTFLDAKSKIKNYPNESKEIFDKNKITFIDANTSLTNITELVRK